MARPEITGRKQPDATEDDLDALSIEQFCKRHGFSPQLYYKHRAQMPKTFRIGARVFISKEAATTWRREREKMNA